MDPEGSHTALDMYKIIGAFKDQDDTAAKALEGIQNDGLLEIFVLESFSCVTYNKRSQSH